MYGMTKETRRLTLQKIRNTKFYLDNNFVKFGDEEMPFSSFFKNAFINSHRYISELQNRVWSIYNYSQARDLVPLFFTLSAPTEHHPKKQIFKDHRFTGKVVRNHKYNPENTPRITAKYLSKCLRKITNDRSWRKIPKADKSYFRVFEPHQDGTPHVHVMFFLPKEYYFQFVCNIHDKFPSPQGEIVVNVESPVHYLMKYIYKTLDDLRYGEDKISDLTLWYVHHGICRIYTSRTLISLDVYRVLGGRYSLNELTLMYKEKRLTIYVDPGTNKPTQIFDEFGQIWTKKIPIDINYNHMHQEERAITSNRPRPLAVPITLNLPSLVSPYLLNKKYIFKEFLRSQEHRQLKQKFKVSSYPVTYDDTLKYQCVNGNLYPEDEIVKIPSRMNNYALFEYYKTLDIENVNFQHFGLTKNECIKRGLIDDVPAPLDSYGVDFDYLEKPLNPYAEQFENFQNYLNEIGA